MGGSERLEVEGRGPDAEDRLHADEADPYAHEGGSDAEGAESGAYEDAPVAIEVEGLSILAHVGVEAAERAVGQRVVLDISVAVDDCEATETDQVEDTIDYAEVCEEAAAVARDRPYRTLERLCSEVADRLIEGYGPSAVTVRAAKTQPPMPLPVKQVSVEVTRERA